MRALSVDTTGPCGPTNGPDADGKWADVETSWLLEVGDPVRWTGTSTTLSLPTNTATAHEAEMQRLSDRRCAQRWHSLELTGQHCQIHNVERMDVVYRKTIESRHRCSLQTFFVNRLGCTVTSRKIAPKSQHVRDHVILRNRRSMEIVRFRFLARREFHLTTK